jgi:hypothetical protein
MNSKTVEAPGQTPTPEPQSQFSHEQIAQCAEKIWRERGSPSGQDEAIWLEAESQLQGQAESRPVSGTPSRPYVDEPAKQMRTRTKTQDPSDAAAQTRSPTENRAPAPTNKLRSQ